MFKNSVKKFNKHAFKTIPRILFLFQLLCGRNIECDSNTYKSEYNSARSNRIILEKLLRESGVNCAEGSTENILKFYTNVRRV
jgi:glutaminase